jgi:hypothetical protein
MMSTPAIALNSSPLRCSDEPGPDEAKEYLPGSFLQSAISSATVLTGRLSVTPSRLTRVASSDTATMSLSGS